MQKRDEGTIIYADFIVKHEIERIIRDNDFEISKEEVDYYKKNLQISKLQSMLVFSYWGKYFGSYRNTNLITREQYIMLLLILKKRLLLQAGCDSQGEFSEYSKLPYILSGNIKDKINTRLIRNNKFIGRVYDSYLHDKLIKEKYSNLNEIKSDHIMSIMSQIINTSFTYVVYEQPELLGKDIEYDEDVLSDELLFFFNSL